MPERPPTTEIEWRLLGAEAAWFALYRVEHDLPALATDALIAGFDSPTLAALAGEPAGRIAADLGEMFAEALAELGRPAPTVADAWRARVAFRCWEVMTGRIERASAAAHVEEAEYDHPGIPDDAEAVVLDFSGLDDWLRGVEEGWHAGEPAEVHGKALDLAGAVVGRFIRGDTLHVPDTSQDDEAPLPWPYPWPWTFGRPWRRPRWLRRRSPGE